MVARADRGIISSIITFIFDSLVDLVGFLVQILQFLGFFHYKFEKIHNVLIDTSTQNAIERASHPFSTSNKESGKSS